MDHCKSRCGYNWKPYSCFSHETFDYDFSPEGSGINSEDIGTNHPALVDMQRCWALMRHGIAGQEAIKANAYEMGYVLVPAGLRDAQNPKKPTLEATHYINRGRFPEVPMRHLLTVLGQLFKERPDFTAPEAVLEIADQLDGRGLTLQGFARKVSREFFTTHRYGVYVQFNEEQGRPEFVRYSAERIASWHIGDDGFPRLIVIEEPFRDTENPYSYEMSARRIQLAIEEGVFTYRVFEKDDDKWVENPQLAAVPTRNGEPLTRIPFVLFGDWDAVHPPLKPIVETTIDYFRAHVEWSHGLFYTAHPTLYADIGEKGQILSADVDENGKPLPYSIDVGATTAHIFRDGSLAYAEVSGAGLAALKDRVTETRNELAGLGARSFVNYASNIAALTESLQQSGDRGVIASFAREISEGIEACLHWANALMGGTETDEIIYRLPDDQDDGDFDLRVLPQVLELVDRGITSNTRVRSFIRDVEPRLMGGLSDEEIDREISEEGSGFALSDIDAV